MSRTRYARLRVVVAAVALLLLCLPAPARAQSQSNERQSAGPAGPWQDGQIGYGFRTGAREVGLDLEGGFGPPVLTQNHEHDLVLGSVHFGWAFAPRWELTGELWGGAQTNPGYGRVLGFTPHVRYLFMNHSRWVPFLDAGLGLADTNIRDRDISTEYEFNIQVGGGVLCFLDRNVALAFEYRWFHLSNADIQTPNRGVNTQLLSIGLSRYL